MPKTFELKKQELLRKHTLIQDLFNAKAGQRKVLEYPFMALWKSAFLDTQYPAQVLFVVSKKYSKRRVHVNRAKRQMRELYRLRKHLMYNVLNQVEMQIILAIIFTGKERFEHAALEEKFDNLFEKLIANIEEGPGADFPTPD